jgi:hypothetical protein
LREIDDRPARSSGWCVHQHGCRRGVGEVRQGHAEHAVLSEAVNEKDYRRAAREQRGEAKRAGQVEGMRRQRNRQRRRGLRMTADRASAAVPMASKCASS